MSDGIILLGHGSRREEANEEIRTIAAMVASKKQADFYETAFLSLTQPDLTEAAARLVQKGVKRILITPVFLVTGNHIARDIPEEIVKLKAGYPKIEFVMSGHVGTHPGVAEIVKERIQEALGKS